MSRHWPWLLVIPAALFVLIRGLSPGRPIELEKQELMRMHQELLRSVRQGDLDTWLGLETEKFVGCAGGAIEQLSPSQRRTQRALWLGTVHLTSYEDVSDPLIQVANDGSLAWLFARVHLVGTKEGADGAQVALDTVEPWVELYQKVAGEWKLSGRQTVHCPDSQVP